MLRTPTPLLGLLAVVFAGCTLAAQCVILASVWDEEDQNKATAMFVEYGSLALITGVAATGILVFCARRSGGPNNRYAAVAGIVTILAVGAYFATGIVAYNVPDAERRQKEFRWDR